MPSRGVLGGDDGRQNCGFAVSGDDGAVGLAGYLAGLEDERAPAPIQLNAVDIEHFGFLSSVIRKGESHEQDGETLRRATARSSQRPAILPWPSFFHRLARTASVPRRTQAALAATQRRA